MFLMNMRQLCKQALKLTEKNARDSRAFDLSCLFEDVLQVRIPSLGRLSKELASMEIPASKAGEFLELVRRYGAGEPLQYLLGKWEFYGLPFFVGPGVLIPRPDTETLAEAALALLKGRDAPLVADLCAGTGCISVTIGAHRPDAKIWAVELSSDAYGYLTRNITLNKSSVTPLFGSALDKAFLSSALPEGGLDLMVSNPPYISAGDMAVLDPLVTYEPATALYGGADGLDFYRALPPLAFSFLKPGGFLALEVGYDQGEAVEALLKAEGFLDIQRMRDLAGMERVVSGRKPER